MNTKEHNAGNCEVCAARYEADVIGAAPLAAHRTVRAVWANELRLAKEIVDLREQLAEAQKNLRIRRDLIRGWQRHVQRVATILNCEALDIKVEHAAEELQSQLAQVEKERERLLRGDFTPEEFQNLCHNADVQAGFDAFADGCEAYQQKMFGRCRKGVTT